MHFRSDLQRFLWSYSFILACLDCFSNWSSFTLRQHRHSHRRNTWSLGLCIFFWRTLIVLSAWFELSSSKTPFKENWAIGCEVHCFLGIALLCQYCLWLPLRLSFFAFEWRKNIGLITHSSFQCRLNVQTPLLQYRRLWFFLLLSLLFI